MINNIAPKFNYKLTWVEKKQFFCKKKYITKKFEYSDISSEEIKNGNLYLDEISNKIKAAFKVLNDDNEELKTMHLILRDAIVSKREYLTEGIKSTFGGKIKHAFYFIISSKYRAKPGSSSSIARAKALLNQIDDTLILNSNNADTLISKYINNEEKENEKNTKISLENIANNKTDIISDKNLYVNEQGIIIKKDYNIKTEINKVQNLAKKLHNEGKKLCLFIGRTAFEPLPSENKDEVWISLDLVYGESKTQTVEKSVPNDRIHLIVDMNKDDQALLEIQGHFNKVVLDHSVLKFLDNDPWRRMGSLLVPDGKSILITETDSLSIYGLPDVAYVKNNRTQADRCGYLYYPKSELESACIENESDKNKFYSKYRKESEERRINYFKRMFKNIELIEDKEYPFNLSDGSKIKKSYYKFTASNQPIYLSFKHRNYNNIHVEKSNNEVNQKTWKKQRKMTDYTSYILLVNYVNDQIPLDDIKRYMLVCDHEEYLLINDILEEFSSYKKRAYSYLKEEIKKNPENFEKEINKHLTDNMEKFFREIPWTQDLGKKIKEDLENTKKN